MGTLTKEMAKYFERIGKWIDILLILCILFVPLGLWKFVEIVIWVFKHVYINFK